MVLFAVLPLAVALLRQGGCHALTRQVSILDPAFEKLTSTALSIWHYTPQVHVLEAWPSYCTAGSGPCGPWSVCACRNTRNNLTLDDRLSDTASKPVEEIEILFAYIGAICIIQIKR